MIPWVRIVTSGRGLVSVLLTSQCCMVEKLGVIMTDSQSNSWFNSGKNEDLLAAVWYVG